MIANFRFFCHKSSVKFKILNHQVYFSHFIDELFQWQKKRKMAVQGQHKDFNFTTASKRGEFDLTAFTMA